MSRDEIAEFYGIPDGPIRLPKSTYVPANEVLHEAFENIEAEVRKRLGEAIDNEIEKTLNEG